jgi:hypothetical protein
MKFRGFITKTSEGNSRLRCKIEGGEKREFAAKSSEVKSEALSQNPAK